MNGTVTLRSSSLPSLEKDDNAVRFAAASDARANRTQSSDSLLSISQLSCTDQDSQSQMSLPELSGTIIDSEGYSSFHSNPSCSPSPFSSNHSSPTGDSDLFIESQNPTNIVDSCSVQENAAGWSEAVYQEDGFLDVKDLDMREKRKTQSGTLCRRNSGEEENRCSVGIDFADGNADSILHHGGNSTDSRPVLGPLLLERRMSTIEECYEETPSPRSFVEIDHHFANAYKSIVWQNKDGTIGIESQESDDINSSALRVSQQIKEFEVLQPYDPLDKAAGSASNRIERLQLGKETAEDPGQIKSKSGELRMDPGGTVQSDGEGEVKREGDLQRKQLTITSNDISSADDCTSSVSSSVKGEGILEDLSVLSEQAFDIDLDLYEIPHQRRESLEIKLSDLRKFVDRVIAERKCLENDRLLLQKTLELINEEQGCEYNTPSTANEARSDDCESNTATGIGSYHQEQKAPEISCQTSDQCIEGASATSYSQSEAVLSPVKMQKNDIEELLTNLEDALLENIELKHTNDDLTIVNEALRQRIEDLLTDEEELRYKLNESTLKLMEDSERQREENFVLRSNFNKVLRDYNSLEDEFKDLEQNYEDLIHERDLIVDELSVKNEDYQRCKDECVRLADKLENAKKELERYNQTEDRVWTRSDWEQWTVLQTRISSTEIALYDARKQKALLICDLKKMKKMLESGKEKIEDAEVAIGRLEITLKRAQEKNKSLQNENEGIKYSILEYEAKLAEFEKMLTKDVMARECQTNDIYIGYSEEDESRCQIDQEWITIEAKYEGSDGYDDNGGSRQAVDNGMNKKPAVLRGDARSANIRRARTFPFHNMETLSMHLFQEGSNHVDSFADSQYHNGFQEVDANRENDGGYRDEDKDSLIMKGIPQHVACSSPNTYQIQGDFVEESREARKKKRSHRHTCFSFKALLPSILQNVLNVKAKKGGRFKSPVKTAENQENI